MSSKKGTKMARETGLEPATPTVTGWYSNQLSYSPALEARIKIFMRNGKNGERDGDRTRNIHRDRVVL